MTSPLKPVELERINAYWRAANYLSVGQIYLYDNPLLREPLTLKEIGERINLTRERVRQLERLAMSKLEVYIQEELG